MNHEERLSKSSFTGLPNVKGTVAEDARITDSPPRSEPVLEIRVRPRAGMLRCSRCGRRCRGHDQGGGVRRRGRFRAVGRAGQPVHTRFRIGTRVADERREPEDRTVVVDHERHRAIWAHDGYGRDVFGLFFQTLTPEQRASIRVVAGDGARWIDSCVHEWCPNAERAPDGFHIVSWTSGAPDNPRKQQKPLFCAIP